MISAIITVLALYLGLLNSFLARFAGTCTQGDADRLYGIVVSVPFFVLALLCLSRTNHPKGTMIVCLPALPLMLWQAWFAVEISFGVLAHKLSACQVIEGVPYEYSGGEIKFAILWPVVILGTLAAATNVYFIRRSKAVKTPKTHG